MKIRMFKTIARITMVGVFIVLTSSWSFSKNDYHKTKKDPYRKGAIKKYKEAGLTDKEAGVWYDSGFGLGVTRAIAWKKLGISAKEAYKGNDFYISAKDMVDIDPADVEHYGILLTYICKKNNIKPSKYIESLKKISKTQCKDSIISIAKPYLANTSPYELDGACFTFKVDLTQLRSKSEGFYHLNEDKLLLNLDFNNKIAPVMPLKVIARGVQPKQFNGAAGGIVTAPSFKVLLSLKVPRQVALSGKYQQQATKDDKSNIDVLLKQ